MNKQIIEDLKDFVRAMEEANCYPKRIEALSQAIQWGKKIEELEKTIDSLVKDKFTKYGNGYGFLATDSKGQKVWVNAVSIAVEQAEEELATLKDDIIENGMKHNDEIIKNETLKRENAKLKEEVKIVRLDCYGEALKNKKLRELLSEEGILKTILKHLQEKVASGKSYLGTFWRDIAKAIAKGKE